MAKENSSPIGIWSLVSFYVEYLDGTKMYTWGKDVGGMLMIDPSRYFSVNIMSMQRPAFKIPDPRAGTPQEIKTAFEKYIGYCGSYDIDETNKKLTFHVKGAWLPNWIGDQIRYYQVEGKRLAITSAPTSYGGKMGVGKLNFEGIK